MADLEKKVWGIHTKDDSLFLKQGKMAIGWREMEKVTGGQSHEEDRSDAVIPIEQVLSPRECPTCGTINYIAVNTLIHTFDKCTNCGGIIL